MPVEAGRRTEALELLPLGDLECSWATHLAAQLSARVLLPCRVLPPAGTPWPRLAGRDQVDANELLRWLEARPPSPSRLRVALTALDLATPIFTFVFGLARQGGQTCVVSAARALPSFYGSPANDPLRDRRVLAEMLHELGHLAGLAHCADRLCRMSFAGVIEKVDLRGLQLCTRCASEAPTWLVGSPAGAASG